LLPSTHRNLAAIAVGIALAGVPAAAVHAWLNGYVEQQALYEAQSSARRAIALAEKRIGGVIAGLEDLARRGVVSCGRADVEAMHAMSFAVLPVKEVSVVGPDGGTLCTNLGLPPGQRQVISSHAIEPHPGLVLEVLSLGPRGEPAVRIRRVATGEVGLGVLVPADLFVPTVSSSGGPFSAGARVTMADGTVIAERSPPHDIEEDLIAAQQHSTSLGLVATVATSRASFVAAHADLIGIGTAGTASFSVLMLVLAAIGLSRPRIDLHSDMTRALKRGEFVPYYQPIVDLTTARVVGAEVLARWRKADGTLVSPAHFIPTAESSGLIVDITRALMRRVRDEAGAALACRPRVTVSFNLSARHFADEAIVQDIKAIFGSSPLSPKQIVLEVTEREPLDNLTVARRVIAALQGLGVHVGIDDVGTGHSGLSYVLKLGVDFMKVDKVFIDAIGNERYSTTIIETLVNLARDMRMDVIAEGVETLEQVEHLRARGIRKAQGFAFAPPLPGASFLRLLEAIEPATPAAVGAAAEPAGRMRFAVSA
jgi:sensor c-di-GMP phosphodiesterase-like protein